MADRSDSAPEGDDIRDEEPSSDSEPADSGPVVDRRDVLGAIAGATLTPALAGAARADRTESTAALPLDRLDELPADGDGLAELLDSTPDDGSQFRELSWSSMARNHIQYRTSNGNEAGNPDPTWHGQSVTRLTLIDADWESFGNPDTDDEDQGCYRYTFQLQSMAMALTPANIAYENPNYVVDEADGFVPHARRLPSMSGPDEQVAYRQATPATWTRLGSDLTVEMPELPEDRGEDWDGPQQHLALSARRDQDLFAAINGRGIVRNLQGNPSELESFQSSTAELVDNIDQLAVVNARQRAANIEERQRDQKAILDATMSTAGLGLFVIGLVVSGPAAVIVGAAGAILTAVGILLGVVSLLKPADEDPLPYYRGFELNLEPGADQAVAGHHITFDAYVTPDIDEPVTFDVTSKHQQDDGALAQLSDVEWGIEIDPPGRGASDAAVWEAASIDHASFWEYGDGFHKPAEPGDPGYRDVATKGPIPGLAMNFDGETGRTTIEDVPVMSFFDSATFDAYDTILHDSEIEEHRWAIYRVGDYAATDTLESTLSSADLSHSSWPPEPEALTLVDAGAGETFEFTPKLEHTLEVDDPQPGTYLVALEADDGSLSNFTYEPLLVGGVPFPYIYGPDVTDGIGDDTDDDPVFPTGATVSFSGDYRNPNELDDADFETFWVVPAEANPDAQVPDPPYGGVGTRGTISDDYLARRGPDAELQLTEPGTYEVEFRAYGEEDVYEAAKMTIEVVKPSTELDYELSEAVQVDLTVEGDASDLELGDSITLSASNARAQGPLELLGFDWDSNGDGTYTDLNDENAEGSLREVKKAFPRGDVGFTEPGVHEFGVLAYAYDSEADEIVGNTARTTVTVQSREPPTARITRPSSNSESIVEIKSYIQRLTDDPFWTNEDHVVWFSAADSELVDSATRFRWAFHDANGVETTALSSPGPTWHVFEEPGTYEVDLEVWYGEGFIAETSTTVEVE